MIAFIFALILGCEDGVDNTTTTTVEAEEAPSLIANTKISSNITQPSKLA